MGEGFGLGVVLKLARIICARRVSILHCHGRGALVYAALAAMLVPRCGLIHTVHRADGDMITGRSLFNRVLLSRVNAVTAVSDAAAHEFSCANGYPEANVQTIYNGIDISRFHNGKPSGGHAKAGPILGSIANLSPDKDCTTLLQGFAGILRSCPGAELLVVGDGPAAAATKRRAEELHVAEHVRFLGFRSDVPDILADLDLLIHSTRTEGMGIAILEAMASGVPVVASRVGGIPEIVDHGKTGLLVASGEPNALSAAVLELLGDEGRRKQMVEASREQVALRFSLEAMCRQYGELYGRVSRSPGNAC